MKTQSLKFLSLLVSLLYSAQTFSSPQKTENWLDIVRQSPYNITKDFYRNIKVIRRWILLGEGYCTNTRRHILFNRRGHFLGYISNEENTDKTQLKLNEKRKSLANQGRVTFWTEGTRQSTGYPFALACEQPHVQMDQALNRMTGKHPSDLVWGTWDGISVGNKQSPVTLIDTVLEVYNHRKKAYQFNQTILRDLMGQILIESGARKYSRSKANATGLLQLRPEVIKDCQIPRRYSTHRMAQVDCALKLYRQNQRNLTPVFNQRFSELPGTKQEKLYAMLLVQAYHGGIGRITALLKDDQMGKAAAYFAKNHKRYSAEEIALGIIFHNLGRHNLGLASLYYLVDVEIAAEELCRIHTPKQASFCHLKVAG